MRRWLAWLIPVLMLGTACGKESRLPTKPEPDQLRIVFNSARDGNYEIYVMNADGSGQTRLTTNPPIDPSHPFPQSVDYLPCWSPDGTKIAFETGRDNDTLLAIYVMNDDGTNPVRLTGSGWDVYAPTWSFDGNRLAFQGTNEFPRYQPSGIYIMDADGTNPVRIQPDSTSGWAPAWSPDGMMIACDGWDGSNYQIYTMNADGTNLRQLTTGSLNDGADWSPDGSKIAFWTNRDGNAEIYVMNTDGSDLIRLTNNAGFDAEPAWSPDGSKIAFASARDGDVEIYVMDADGTHQIRLTRSPGEDSNPDWGPKQK